MSFNLQSGSLFSQHSSRNLESLAALLGEAAAALRHYCRENGADPDPGALEDTAAGHLDGSIPEELEDDFVEREMPIPESASPASDSEAGRGEEVRCYRFSPQAREIERELCAEHGEDSLQALFLNASMSLAAYTALLRNLNPEARIEGFVVHILARELERVDDLLFKIQELCNEVELVDVSHMC